MGWRKYRPNLQIEARRVTKESGEHVNTLNGSVFAPHGFYIIRERINDDDAWYYSIDDAESFHTKYVLIPVGFVPAQRSIDSLYKEHNDG
jgi:hypothetical protein